MRTEFIILFGGLFAIFVGLSVLFSGESKPVDFCDGILTFDGDVDSICAERFEQEMREVCSIVEPDVDEDYCLSSAILLLVDDCVATEERLEIDKNVCMYKKMKSFKSDFERWNK